MTTGLRKFISSFALIAIFLAFGIVAAVWLYSTKPEAERSLDAPLPPMVNVRTIVEEDLREIFTGYGSARADVDVILASEVRGVVVEVSEGLNDGVHVESGQLLVRIDDRPYRQQLAKAGASIADMEAQIDQLDVEKSNTQRLVSIAKQEVEVNRNEWNRLMGLFEREAASKKELDFARLAYQQSRRQLTAYQNQIDLVAPRRAVLEAMGTARAADAALAQLDIDRCGIKAPFSGEVVRVAVDAGDHVLLGAEIVHLISTRLVEIPVELASSVRADVHLGARCTLEVDSQPGVQWMGTIARIAPSSDAQSRTFAAYIEVNNDEQSQPLIPGSFLTARVEGPLLQKVVAVPRGAIVADEVYVANDEVIHLRSIVIERIVGERAVVTGELKPGDRLVYTNLDKLFDGARVRVEEPPTNAIDDAPLDARANASSPPVINAGDER